MPAKTKNNIITNAEQKFASPHAYQKKIIIIYITHLQFDPIYRSVFIFTLYIRTSTFAKYVIWLKTFSFNLNQIKMMYRLGTLRIRRSSHKKPSSQTECEINQMYEHIHSLDYKIKFSTLSSV